MTAATRLAVLFLILVGGAGVALAWGPLRGQLWGFHAWAFLPPATAAILLLWGGAVGVLFRPAPAAVPFPAGTASRGQVLGIGGVLLAAGAGFWILRLDHLLLGDGLPIAASLPEKDPFHARLPLSQLILVQWYRMAEGWFTDAGPDGLRAVHDTVAVLSVLCGVVFVGVVAALARVLAAPVADPRHRGITAILAGALLLSQGYMQLFFGYVEYYPLTLLALSLYVLSGLLYLRNRVPLAVPGLLAVALVGLHMSSVLVAPSFLVLAARGVRERGSRVPALRDLAVVGGGIAGLQWLLSSLRSGYGLAPGLRAMLKAARSEGGETEPGSLLSLTHLRDFVNEQFLIGPAAGLLLLLLLVPVVRRWRSLSTETGFLLTAALLLLGASWMTVDTRIGYARDWDAFAAPAFLYAAAAVSILVSRVPSPALGNLLLALVLFSAGHTAGWVLLNHSETRSLSRLAEVPLGYGRNFTVIGNWHLRRGEIREAERWFERSLEAYPANGVTHHLMGILKSGENRLEEAIPHLRNAVILRPDKEPWRRELVATLHRAGRAEEALPHLEILNQSSPLDGNLWTSRIASLQELGRVQESEAVRARALGIFREHLGANPRDAETIETLGILHAQGGETDVATTRFEEALALESTREFALLNLIQIRITGQDPGDALPLIERFLETYPGHPLTGDLQRMRDQIAGRPGNAGP